MIDSGTPVHWRRLLPFLIGGQVGLPLGIELLRLVPAPQMRAGIGVFLVAFSLYSLLKPSLCAVKGTRPLADCGVAVLSGVVGGATGLAGILPTIWSTVRAGTRTSSAPSSSPRPSPSSPARLCGWAAPPASIATPFVRDRPAGPAARHLGRPQCLQPSRRDDVPQDRAGPTAAVGSALIVPRWVIMTTLPAPAQDATRALTPHGNASIERSTNSVMLSAFVHKAMRPGSVMRRSVASKSSALSKYTAKRSPTTRRRSVCH